MKTYYKVVRPSLRSSICNPGVQYAVGEWAVAPEEADRLGYGLLVFRDLKSAKKFCSDSPKERLIYECEIRGLQGELPPIGCPLRPDPWNSVDLSDPGWWPVGTMMVTAVKLLEEVKE